MDTENGVTQPSKEQIEEQAMQALEFIQYFNQLEASSPFLRYIIAGALICIALVLLLFVRITT